MKECNYGREAEEVNTKGQEVEAKQAEGVPLDNFNVPEETNYEAMTVVVLRDMLKDRGVAGIYGMSKDELIVALKECG